LSWEEIEARRELGRARASEVLASGDKDPIKLLNVLRHVGSLEELDRVGLASGAVKEFVADRFWVLAETDKEIHLSLLRLIPTFQVYLVELYDAVWLALGWLEEQGLEWDRDSKSVRSKRTGKRGRRQTLLSALVGHYYPAARAEHPDKGANSLEVREFIRTKLAGEFEDELLGTERKGKIWNAISNLERLR